MRILWVATKSPWPPVDGGRLLLWETLGALAAAGHDVTLVAPAPPAGLAEARAAPRGALPPLPGARGGRRLLLVDALRAAAAAPAR